MGDVRRSRKRAGKQILNLFVVLAFVFLVLEASYKICMRVAKNKDAVLGRFKMYYRLLCIWISIPDCPGKIEAYFIHNNIRKVAIYGAADLGKRLFEQMQDSEIQIVGFIDRSSYSNAFSSLPSCMPDKMEFDIDAVVVTPFADFQNIEKLLRKNDSCKKCQIISLEDIIDYAKKV